MTAAGKHVDGAAAPVALIPQPVRAVAHEYGGYPVPGEAPRLPEVRALAERYLVVQGHGPQHGSGVHSRPSFLIKITMIQTLPGRRAPG